MDSTLLDALKTQLEEIMEKLQAQHKEEMQPLKEEIMALRHQISSMSPVLADKQWMSQSSLMNHQKPLEELEKIESTSEIPWVNAVDDMIRSPPHPMLGDSPLRSCYSLVESMIVSRTPSSKTEFDSEITPPTSQQGQAQPQTLQLSSTASSSSEFNFEISPATYQQGQTQLQTLQNQTQTIFRRPGLSGLDDLAYGTVNKLHPLKIFVKDLRNLFAMGNFVEELKREEEDLIATRNSVQDRVDHAKKQTLKTAEVVHKWLKDADIGIEDVNNLLNKAITKKKFDFEIPISEKISK